MFSPCTLPLVNIFVRHGEKHFRCRNLWFSSLRSCRSFEDKVNLTNREQEPKTVKKFLDLWALWFLLTAGKIVTSMSFPRRVPHKALQTHRYRMDRLSVLQNHSKCQLFLQQISQLQKSSSSYSKIHNFPFKSLEATACSSSTLAKLKALMFLISQELNMPPLQRFELEMVNFAVAAVTALQLANLLKKQLKFGVVLEDWQAIYPVAMGLKCFARNTPRKRHRSWWFYTPWVETTKHTDRQTSWLFLLLVLYMSS